MNKTLEVLMIGAFLFIVGVAGFLLSRELLVPIAKDITNATIGNWTGLFGGRK